MGTAGRFITRLETRNGVARLTLSGELDLGTAPALNERLASLGPDGVRAIILDLRELTFIDSTGLHTLIRARWRQERDGRRFVLIEPSRIVRNVFDVAGTNFLLEDPEAASVLRMFTAGETGSC